MVFEAVVRKLMTPFATLWCFLAFYYLFSGKWQTCLMGNGKGRLHILASSTFYSICLCCSFISFSSAGSSTSLPQPWCVGTTERSELQIDRSCVLAAVQIDSDETCGDDNEMLPLTSVSWNTFQNTTFMFRKKKTKHNPVIICFTVFHFQNI